MILSTQVPLKKYSNYKIGGPCSYFYEFKSKEDLIEALSEYRQISPEGKTFVLGGGTNVLFSDGGFDGLVLKNSISHLEIEGDMVNVGAGTLMSDLLSFCSSHNLTGLEWAGGLPGTVGGAIRGNAGAFLGEAGDKVEEVESFDQNSGETVIKKRKDCQFGYRQSIFKIKGGEEIILSAKFKLKKGNAEDIKKTTQEKIDYRIDRHPLDLPNIGSTFKNVDLGKVTEKVRGEFKSSIKDDPFPVIPVAKILISAGLMGKSVGGVKFSEKHPNFIVNYKNGKAADVKKLVKLAKEQIRDKYGIELEEEIMVM